MTREEIYSQCIQKIDKTSTLLLEAATGTGKTKISIDLVNHLRHRNPSGQSPILILVAKRVHKQTWQEEIEKWGGIHGNPNIIMECYESLHKHTKEHFSVILADDFPKIQVGTVEEYRFYTIYLYNQR